MNMPELTARHGYLAVCIVSAVCILVELVIFKWKNGCEAAGHKTSCTVRRTAKTGKIFCA